MEAMMEGCGVRRERCVFQGTAHWIPEECPPAPTEQLVTFLKRDVGAATTGGEWISRTRARRSDHGLYGAARDRMMLTQLRLVEDGPT